MRYVFGAICASRLVLAARAGPTGAGGALGAAMIVGNVAALRQEASSVSRVVVGGTRRHVLLGVVASGVGGDASRPP